MQPAQPSGEPSRTPGPGHAAPASRFGDGFPSVGDEEHFHPGVGPGGGECPGDTYCYGDAGFWGAVDEPPEPAWALAASARVQRELLAQAASAPPGEASAAILARCCPDGREDQGTAGLDAAGLLDGIGGLQRLIGWAQAAQQRFIAALARPGVVLPVEDLLDVAGSPLGIARDIPDLPEAALLQDPVWGPALREAAVKVAAVEIGCVLHVAPVTARGRTERAVDMVDSLPATLAAQQAGELDGFRASIIAERTAVLDPQQRRMVEDAVLPTAAARTPSRVRELVDRQVVRADPDAATRREHRARRDRGVHVQPGQDGMACLRADLPAADAQITYQVLDAMAATMRAAGLAAGRGRSQLRADILTDLFRDLGAHGPTPGNIHRAHTGGLDTGGMDEDTDDESTDSVGEDTDSIDEDTDTDRAERSGADRDVDGDASGRGDPGGGDAGARGEGADPDAGARSEGADPDTGDVVDAAVDADEDDDSTADDSGAHSGRARRWALPVCVNVFVAASTLAGFDNEPGELAGCGVISADLARALAESAATIRAIAVRPPGSAPPGAGQQTIAHSSPPGAGSGLSVGSGSGSGPGSGSGSAAGSRSGPAPGPGSGPGSDSASRSGPAPGSGSGAVPEWTATGHSTNPARARLCGSILDAGRARYRPGQAAADYVSAGDRTCCFPGCRARATRCDLDHRLPYHQGGATCPCNLDALCRSHHLIKTFTPWTATPSADGTLTWTGPTGHHYPTEPPHALLDLGGAPSGGESAPPPGHNPSEHDEPPPF